MCKSQVGEGYEKQCKIQPVLLMGLWLMKAQSVENVDTFILLDGKHSNYNLKHLPNSA